jgi:alkanesulfonate monooxygenase SsuD/methylene tetrahydromethanopterin reductase-like flavin-dependent oxidoreductase (luciferase family)
MAEAAGVDPAALRAYMVVGGPDTVREKVEQFRAAGLDGMIFGMPDVGDLEAVRLAGETLSAVLA